MRRRQAARAQAMRRATVGHQRQRQVAGTGREVGGHGVTRGRGGGGQQAWAKGGGGRRITRVGQQVIDEVIEGGQLTPVRSPEAWVT